MSSVQLDEALPILEASALDVTPREVRSPARRRLLAMAAATCGATVAAAMFQPARADIVAALGKFLDLDFTVLNFAFEMEEMESEFFRRLPSTSGYMTLGERARGLLDTIANQDYAHFKLLEQVRVQVGDQDAGRFDNANASASRRPRTFKFGRLDTAEQVLNTAIDIKENVVFAYHGAVGVVRNKDLLATAAAIAGIEGQHLAALREIHGLDPVPAPFEGALTPQVAGRKLGRFGFTGGAPR